MANQFIFFCGGSGARAAEAYAYCAAMGLMGSNNNVHIVLCDPDTQMGNAARAFGILQQYQSIRSGIYNDKTNKVKDGDFFCTPITVSQWALDSRKTPSNEHTLRNLVETGSFSNWVASALFSTDELDNRISDLGFVAHPNVGSVVARAAILRESESNHADRPYNKIKEDMKRYLQGNQDVHAFFVGSLFGGTGASYMPTIAQKLDEDLKKYRPKNARNNKCFIGACMLLPYFTIPNVADNAREQKVTNEMFEPSSKMALNYYSTKTPELFDAIYPLGLSQQYAVPGPAVFGGSQQENPVSLVEWSAAAACLDFVSREHKSDSTALYCGYLTTKNNKVVLNDNSFMMPKFGSAFVRWMNFVSFYGLYLYPNIRQGRSGKNPGNWYRNYIQGQVDDNLEKCINHFCLAYCNVLYELLGLTLDEQYRPDNELVDRSKFVGIKKFLEDMDNKVWKVKDVKKAHNLMCKTGFRVTSNRHQNNCDTGSLIRALSTTSAQHGSFGTLLQLLNDAL